MGTTLTNTDGNATHPPVYYGSYSLVIYVQITDLVIYANKDIATRLTVQLGVAFGQYEGKCGGQLRADLYLASASNERKQSILQRFMDSYSIDVPRHPRLKKLHVLRGIKVECSHKTRKDKTDKTRSRQDKTR